MLKPDINIFSIIIGAGIVQGVFFGLYLILNKNGNKRANRMLAVLLFVFSCSMIHSVININNHDAFIFFPIKVREPFLLLLGPLLLMYVKELTGTVLHFKLKDFFHGIPFILYFLVILPFINHPGLTPYGNISTIIIWGLILIQNIIYFYKIQKSVKVYEKSIKNTFSDIEKISLKWINNFTYIFLAINIFFIAVFIMLIHSISYDYLNKAILLILSISIYGLCYRGLFQIEVFKYPVNKIKNAIQSNESKLPVKYKRSGLKEEEAKEISVMLLEKMEEEKPFKNPELTLPMLADILEIQSNYLSQIINEQTGSNFYDFINKYRVEEVKKMLCNPQKNCYTILSFAFDAGFNSKPSFNKVFKRFTGLTPSQYKKQYQKNILK